MTVSAQDSEQDSEQTAAEPAAPRVSMPARRVGVRVAGVLTVLAVVGVVTWQILAQTALGGVRVVFDVDPVRCEGATVGTMPDTPVLADGAYRDDVYFDEEFYEPRVDITEGMRCALRLHVFNDGWADVAVEAVGVPGMAERMAWPLRVSHVNPNGQTQLADVDDAARFEIEGISIPRGERQTFLVIVEYSGDRTTMEECSSFWPLPPHVVAAAGGATRVVAPADGVGIWYRMGKADGSDCASG